MVQVNLHRHCFASVASDFCLFFFFLIVFGEDKYCTVFCDF